MQASGSEVGIDSRNIEMSPEELQKLRAEFKAIDLNGDGRVDKLELDRFLMSKGIEEGHRQTIVEELFVKCDEDNNGRIDLDEFVKHYLDTKLQL
jgi:Ca2+-binding EF-hand superfamily protein